MFNLAAQDLGSAWGTIGHALLLTSVFAAMLSYHASASRYVFSLGREGVLPSGVRPHAAQDRCAGVGLADPDAHRLRRHHRLRASAGLDPLVNLFFWLGTTGGFGVLMLLAGHIGGGDRLLLAQGRRKRVADR